MSYPLIRRLGQQSSKWDKFARAENQSVQTNTLHHYKCKVQLIL